MHACSLLKGRTNTRRGACPAFYLTTSRLSALCCFGDTDGGMRWRSKKKKNALLHTVDLWRLLELISKGLPSSLRLSLVLLCFVKMYQTVKAHLMPTHLFSLFQSPTPLLLSFLPSSGKWDRKSSDFSYYVRFCVCVVVLCIEKYHVKAVRSFLRGK